MLRSALVSIRNGVKLGGGDDSSDVRVARGGGFGIPKMKEFKLTLRKDSDTSKGGRKRKRVDYAEMGGGQEDKTDGDAGSGSDSDGAPSKKKKTKGKKGINLEGMGKGIGPDGASLIKINRRRYEVAIKEGGLKRQFHFPTMRRDGQKVEFIPTRQALGTRLGIEIPPRPLHDPMGESAIVLFDPTVDDIELTREQDRLQKIQADAEAKLTQEENSSNGSSKKEEPSQKLEPDQTVHKNLADILGIRRKDPNAKPPKVPVVIDPRLTAILRPHQVEGVKVSERMHICGSIEYGVLIYLFILLYSSCIDVLQVLSKKVLSDLSWQMVWDWVKHYSASLSCGLCSSNLPLQANQQLKSASSHVLRLLSEIGRTK